MIHIVIAYATPFLLAATGGLLTEISGMLNIALEGLMLFGAFFAILGTSLSGSLAVGIIGAVLASFLLAALFAYLSIRLKSNIFITGLGTNLFASGAVALTSLWFFGSKGVIRLDNGLSLKGITIPLIAKVPVLGDMLSGHTVITYLSWLIVAAAMLVIYRTSFGLNLRGAGFYPRALRSRGADPDRYRFIAILASGVTCGLAGAQLSLNLGAWVPNISAGRGWIALVAIYLGYKHPLGTAAACLLFALAEYGGISLQGRLHVPASLMLAFPYIVTFIALSIVTIARRERLK
ncbi:MAG: ABC transporter permease [Spirochaetales bacterium]|nr:ABC transporter permease [Spirochaetales bacterium]